MSIAIFMSFRAPKTNKMGKIFSLGGMELKYIRLGSLPFKLFTGKLHYPTCILGTSNIEAIGTSLA